MKTTTRDRDVSHPLRLSQAYLTRASRLQKSIYYVQCTLMKTYGIADFRRQLAHVLDEAARGEHVIVERKGKRFRLVEERIGPRKQPPEPFFELTDDALLEGWTWQWEEGEMQLRGSRRGAP